MSDQAVEQSMEDRIAAQFGVDEAIDEEPEADEPEAPEVEAEADADESQEAAADEESVEPLETIEIEGTEYEVPTALKQSFMRQSDYTQKTQRIADTMRALELQQESLEQSKREQEFYQSISQELQSVNQIDNWLNQQRDWNAMSSEEMMRTKLEMDSYRDYRNQLANVIGQKQQEFNASQEKAHRDLLEKGHDALRKAIHGWDDAMAKSVSEYAISEGFTEKEINTITDPRWVKALHKAKLFDELQAGASQAVKAAKEPPAIKPKSARPMPEDVKRKLNYRKSMKAAKTPQDKAKLIESRVADMF